MGRLLNASGLIMPETHIIESYAKAYTRDYGGQEHKLNRRARANIHTFTRLFSSIGNTDKMAARSVIKSFDYASIASKLPQEVKSDFARLVLTSSSLKQGYVSLLDIRSNFYCYFVCGSLRACMQTRVVSAQATCCFWLSAFCAVCTYSHSACLTSLLLSRCQSC